MSFAWEDFALFNRELAAAVDAGVPLPEGLRKAALEASRPGTRRILEEVGKEVERGASLDKALAGHDAEFPKPFMAIVQGGIAGGNLSEMLRHAAMEAETSGRLRRDVILSAIYPGVVMILCLVFFTVLSPFIYNYSLGIPTFDDLDRTPAIVQIIFGWPGRNVEIIWIAVGIPVVFYLFTVFAGHRIDSLNRLRWKVLFILPFVSRTVKAGLRSRFFLGLEGAVRAGIPLPRGMGLVRDMLAGTPYSEQMKAMAAKAESGLTLSASMDSIKFVPPSAAWSIKAAEARGDVALSLGSLRKAELDRYEKGIDLVRSFAAPIFSVAAGIVLLWAIVSIYIGYLFYSLFYWY